MNIPDQYRALQFIHEIAEKYVDTDSDLPPCAVERHSRPAFSQAVPSVPLQRTVAARASGAPA
jgi:hypothetical protein